MKKTPNKTSPPTLLNGQWWQVKGGYVQIVGVGRTLVDYKMPKNPGQKAVRMQMSSVANVLAYLKANQAKLVTKPAALRKPTA